MSEKIADIIDISSSIDYTLNLKEYLEEVSFEEFKQIISKVKKELTVEQTTICGMMGRRVLQELTKELWWELFSSLRCEKKFTHLYKVELYKWTKKQYVKKALDREDDLEDPFYNKKKALFE